MALIIFYVNTVTLYLIFRRINKTLNICSENDIITPKYIYAG